MSGPSKTTSKRKRTDERIDLSEWGNAGALEGLLSFLNIKPEEAAVHQFSNPPSFHSPRLGKSVPTAETSSTAENIASEHTPVSITNTLPVIDTVPVTSSEESQDAISGEQFSNSSTQSLPVIDPLPVIDTLADIETFKKLRSDTAEPQITIDVPAPSVIFLAHPKQANGFGNKRIYRCQLAQDGHSHGEEALYQVLWKAGKQETEDTRSLSIGYGELSRKVRLSFNNVKAACHRLISKLAIEEIAREVSHERQGKTYRVYSYKSILERRRAAGLEWVIRSKGVEFVTPTQIFSAETASITGTPPVIDPVTIRDRDLPPIPGTPSLSITGTLLENSFRNSLSQSSSAERSVLLQALATYGIPDDDAAILLIRKCRAEVQDCTTEEIVHFIHQKGSLVQRMNIGNPIGFLLTSVPKCFVGETFRLFRSEQQRLQEAAEEQGRREREELEQWRREQERLIKDPGTPEEERAWLRRMLDQ